MRSLLLLGLLCMACTRPNPAFGDSGTGKGGSATDGDSSTGELPPLTSDSGSITVADATSDTSDTTDPPTDLPGEASCDLQPTDGLTIALGDPSVIGSCPNSFGIPVMLAAANGDGVVLRTCESETCDPCAGTEHPLSIPSLPLGEIIPEEVCLRLQADTKLAETETSCEYGALTLHAPATGAPYVIATTASTPPTLNGANLLAGAVPPPVDALFCECAAFDLPHACCEQSGPSFLSYEIAGMPVLPGGHWEIEIPNEIGLGHTFHSVAAQRLPCADAEPELSWAVVPTL